MQIKRKKRRTSSRFWQLKLDANITNITVYGNERVVLWNRQLINVSAKCAIIKGLSVWCVYGGTQVCDLIMSVYKIVALQVALVVKCPSASAGDAKDGGWIPGLGKSPWGLGHGNPLQCSCLENPMDRGAWGATVHGVAKSRTQLKRLSMHTHLQNNVKIHPDYKTYISPWHSTIPFHNECSFPQNIFTN